MVIKKCYIYTRVSTAAQVEGYSLDAQVEALKRYAEYRELQIVGEYCDAGKSGKDIKGRPAFRQMMEDVMSQKDDVAFVLVFKLSRFGRNAADILRSLQTLNDYGINLVSVSESIDSSTQGGRLTLAILSAVAEMERENISVQFMAGRIQKVLNGGWVGGAIPYGYRSIDRRLQIDDYEAEIIRKVFELYRMEGSTATSVADDLNKSPYECRDMLNGGTKPFTYEFVKRVIDNPFYCGRLYFNRRTNKKDHNGKIIKCDPKNIIEVQGNHEPIVSEELWEEAHAKRVLIAERYKKSAENVYTHILTGVVRCPVCGKNLMGSVSKTKRNDGEGYYKAISYYMCSYSGKQKGKVCSYVKRLNQEIIDGLVFEIIGKLQYYGEFKTALENALGTADTLEKKKQKLKELRIELRDAEFSKNKLGEQLDGLNPLKLDYDKKYNQISDKLDEAYDRIDELEGKISKTMKMIEAMQKKSESYIQVTEFLENLEGLLEKMTPEEKKELCNSFIESVDVFEEDRDDGKIIKSISFKFPLVFDGKELNAMEDEENGFSFTLDCSEIDIELPEKGGIVMKTMSDGSQKVIVRKPTYKAIKAYVKENFGAIVSTLNIAQTKRKYGVDIGVAYNKPAEPKSRVPNCTPQKEKMILEAFKHFDLVAEDTQFKEGER